MLLTPVGAIGICVDIGQFGAPCSTEPPSICGNSYPLVNGSREDKNGLCGPLAGRSGLEELGDGRPTTAGIS